MSVSLALVVVMAVMYSCGVFMLLERSMTRVLIGFLLLGNATNVLIMIVSGRLGVAPIFAKGVAPEDMLDPLPQALSLTAIVITFGLSAFLLALIYRSWHLGRADELQDDEFEDDEEDIAVGTRQVAVADERSDPEAGSDTDFEQSVLSPSQQQQALEDEESFAADVEAEVVDFDNDEHGNQR